MVRPRAPFADAVARLAAYRGITDLGALTLASEVCDWRRFPTAAMFMGFCGLVPSEHSSRRAHPAAAASPTPATPTCAPSSSSRPGPTSHRPAVGVTLAKRQHGLDPAVVARAWAAQQRLCGKFRRLDARKTNRKIVVTAIARELAGFVWAEMTAA